MPWGILTSRRRGLTRVGGSRFSPYEICGVWGGCGAWKGSMLQRRSARFGNRSCVLVLFCAARQPELALVALARGLFCKQYSEQLGAVREFADLSGGETRERFSLCDPFRRWGGSVSPVRHLSPPCPWKLTGFVLGVSECVGGCRLERFSLPAAGVCPLHWPAGSHSWILIRGPCREVQGPLPFLPRWRIATGRVFWFRSSSTWSTSVCVCVVYSICER